MQRIYSKINKDILLLTLIKKNDITDSRIDLSPEEEILQVAVKRLKKGTSFKPHKHNEIHRITDTTQESWVFKDNTIIYEFKNWPYYGVEADKTFIIEK